MYPLPPEVGGISAYPKMNVSCIYTNDILQNWKGIKTSMERVGVGDGHKLPSSVRFVLFFSFTSLTKCLLGLWTLADSNKCVGVCVCTVDGLDTQRIKIIHTGFHVS